MNDYYYGLWFTSNSCVVYFTRYLPLRYLVKEEVDLVCAQKMRPTTNWLCNVLTYTIIMTIKLSLFQFAPVTFLLLCDPFRYCLSILVWGGHYVTHDEKSTLLKFPVKSSPSFFAKCERHVTWVLLEVFGLGKHRVSKMLVVFKSNNPHSCHHEMSPYLALYEWSLLEWWVLMFMHAS